MFQWLLNDPKQGWNELEQAKTPNMRWIGRFKWFGQFKWTRLVHFKPVGYDGGSTCHTVGECSLAGQRGWVAELGCASRPSNGSSTWARACRKDFRAGFFHFGLSWVRLQVGLGLRLGTTSCLVLYKTMSCCFLRVASLVQTSPFRCETTSFVVHLEGTFSGTKQHRF